MQEINTERSIFKQIVSGKLHSIAVRTDRGVQVGDELKLRMTITIHSSTSMTTTCHYTGNDVVVKVVDVEDLGCSSTLVKIIISVVQDPAVTDALDALYRKGYSDKHNSRDFDPRSCDEYQTVLNMLNIGDE